MLSSIVKRKLPKFFLRELCRKVGSSKPNYEEFLSHASAISQLLTAGDYRTENESKRESKPVKVTSNYHEKTKLQTAYVKDNFPLSKQQPVAKGCKFCNLDNHSSLHCKKIQ